MLFYRGACNQALSAKPLRNLRLIMLNDRQLETRFRSKLFDAWTTMQSYAILIRTHLHSTGFDPSLVRMTSQESRTYRCLSDPNYPNYPHS